MLRGSRANTQHQITQARLRQNQPQLVLEEEDGLKRGAGADDEDSDSRRKKPRGKKRDE